MRILVTGGAGYLGSVLSMGLVEQGHDLRVLDNLRYGGRSLLGIFGHPHFDLVVGDLRDPRIVDRALHGVDAIVHLAAIVGDPACATEPDVARAINETASLRLIAAAKAAGVTRFVFASTCSNYGRMRDPAVLATEEHELRPLSRYAETKVAVEHELLDNPLPSLAATVLRFATLFGVSPRMRFDLTVNQFVMEMLVHKRVVVFGERFWRPYVHVRDAARAVMAVLGAPPETVRNQVFNVGSTAQNYRKVDLIEIISRRVPDAQIEYVAVADDPRDYKVSFERIRTGLGFEPRHSVTVGVEELARVIESGVLGSVSDPTFSNLGHAGQVNTTAGTTPAAQCVR